MKIIPIAGLEPHCSDYSVFASSYGNTRISTVGWRVLNFPLQVRRLFGGSAYSSKYGNRFSLLRVEKGKLKKIPDFFLVKSQEINSTE